MEIPTEVLSNIIVNDKRGQPKPAKPEVHGKVEGFVPAGDYVLVRRLKSIDQDGMIVRPEVAVELAERGVVIAISPRLDFQLGAPPIGAVAKFSKYGAEEINFDDADSERYALVRTSDIRGWHAGS
jgi:co-chaperonin GroES (HSP10)